MELKHVYLMVGLLLIALSISCGGDGSTEPRVVSEGEINALIQSGWQLFESKDYSGSEAKFDSAVSLASSNSLFESLQAEAESGRGWSRANLRKFSSSKIDFTNSLSRTNRNATTDLNSKAGLAFVHHALNEFDLAIQRALEVLALDSNYTFEHDSRVYHKSLRLLLAQSYYTLGDFQKAAEQLDILEPDKAPHSTDPNELLRKIQELWSRV
jgi:tetratricopeptide (TPR) repeat protein